MYAILPALEGKTDEESNDASLVVLVDDGIISIVILGDATESTTRHHTSPRQSCREREAANKCCSPWSGLTWQQLRGMA